MAEKQGLSDQQILVEGEKIILHNRYETDGTERDCRDERKDSNNGWTEERSMRKIAEIPLIYIMSDMNLLMFRKYLPIDDREARIYLNKFLMANPQYKTSGGRFV